MSNLPPEARALRRELYAGLIAFVVGFVGVLAALGWLIARVVAPDARWWDILHVSINAILFSLLGGGCCAAAAMWALDRVHHWRGIYRCPYCDKPLKGIGIPCDCPEVQALMNEETDQDRH
jgi:hypothetical protein